MFDHTFQHTLHERITAMLNESGLSKAFWTECLAALVHVLDRCPTSAVKGITPYEAWYKRKPDVSHLRVWGCLAYVHVQKDKRKKLESHMEKCIFIGYPEGYKGWKFYNPETKKVIICERADFDERYTYDGQLLKSAPELKPLIPMELEPTSVVPLPEVVNQPEENEKEHEDVEESDTEDKDAEEEEKNMPLEEQPVVHNSLSQPDPIIQHQVEDEDNRPIALRRTRRDVRAPGEWWKVRHPTPVIPSDSEDEEEEVHVVVSGEIEPQSFREAMHLPLADKWKEACLEEYNQLALTKWHMELG